LGKVPESLIFEVPEFLLKKVYTTGRKKPRAEKKPSSFRPAVF